MTSPVSYLSLLPRDVLRSIWLSRNLLDESKECDISLFLSKASAFQDVAAEQMKEVVIDAQNAELGLSISPSILLIGDKSEPDVLTRLLERCGSATCFRLEIERRGPRHTDLTELTLRSCVNVRHLVLNSGDACGTGAYSEQETHIMCNVVRTLGAKLESLTVTGDSLHIIANTIGGHCKRLESFAILDWFHTDCLDLMDKHWASIGATLLKLTVEGPYYDDYGSVMNRVKMHCPKLRTVEFQAAGDEIVPLCISLKAQLNRLVASNISANGWREVMDACPNLEECDIEDTRLGRFERMLILQHRVETLHLSFRGVGDEYETLPQPEMTEEYEALRQASVVCPNIQRLTCEEHGWRVASKFLLAFFDVDVPRSRLQYLTLVVGKDECIPKLMEMVAKKTRNLQSLTVYTLVFDRPDLLDQVAFSNRHLEELRVILECEEDERLDNAVMRAFLQGLVDALSYHRRLVLLYVWTVIEWDNDEAKEILQPLVERGVNVITTT